MIDGSNLSVVIIRVDCILVGVHSDLGHTVVLIEGGVLDGVHIVDLEGALFLAELPMGHGSSVVSIIGVGVLGVYGRVL